LFFDSQWDIWDGIAEFAGLETAGLENGRRSRKGGNDGLENGGLILFYVNCI